MNTIPWTRFSFPLSLILHLALYAGLTWELTRKATVPFGSRRLGEATLIEFGVDMSPPRAKSATFHEAVPKPVLKSEKPEVQVRMQKSSAQPTAARFGTRGGTTRTGLMGHARGYEASPRERYLYELRTYIEGRKTYPQQALRMRESGTVKVRFHVLKNGSIESVELISLSPFPRLNRATLDLIQGIRQYKPLPDAVEQASLEIELPVEYVIN